MRIFVSHCSEDDNIIRNLIELIKIDKEKDKIFYSSKPIMGVNAGEEIYNRINEELEICDIFVPVITKNYLRSLYCLYELSVAKYLKDSKGLDIVPITKEENLRGRIDKLFPKELLYIDVSNTKTRTEFFKKKFPTDNSESQIDNVLEQLNKRLTAKRPFIGMTDEEYNAIMKYCEEYSVLAFRNTSIPMDKVANKLKDAKDIYILSTTGASLVKALCASELVNSLKNGANVNVIIPNQYSSFCEDVAEIERPTGKAENMERLAQEFSAVVGYLEETVAKAKKDCDPNIVGKVKCYCSYNILRQTVLLIVDRNGKMWGNVSITIPPKKTIDGTPSIEVCGSIGDKNTLAELMREHCEQIMSMAVRRGGVIEINIDRKTPKFFFFEKKHAVDYWTNKYNIAKSFMENRREEGEKILIEIAAQHPLRNKKVPGKEFAKRLDTAIEIYNDLKANDKSVVLYVPGSVHKSNSVVDDVSLSYAGVNYLLSKGVSHEDVLGEDANEKYKGQDGVYNSADECYVASEIFKNGDYEQLICICSPNQVMRKTLYYVEFGVIPQCYGVPTNKMFHNVLDEIFNSLNNVVYKDHSAQDSNSEIFIKSRIERRP